MHYRDEVLPRVESRGWGLRVTLRLTVPDGATHRAEAVAPTKIEAKFWPSRRGRRYEKLPFAFFSGILVPLLSSRDF